jgi:hypothetical protein
MEAYKHKHKHKHNIPNESQFVFTKNKSTSDAIATIIENIIDNMNEKIKCIFFFNSIQYCVLLDLLKVFDYVQHNILVNKLYNYGVRGIPHKLIKSHNLWVSRKRSLSLRTSEIMKS